MWRQRFDEEFFFLVFAISYWLIVSLIESLEIISVFSCINCSGTHTKYGIECISDVTRIIQWRTITISIEHISITTSIAGIVPFRIARLWFGATYAHPTRRCLQIIRWVESFYGTLVGFVVAKQKIVKSVSMCYVRHVPLVWFKYFHTLTKRNTFWRWN